MLLIATVLGLLCGSFANVLIARVPADEQWWSGSSRCLSCHTDIAWYDNIPLVSWIVLRGRCRSCNASIGLRYPLVEVLCGALFALIAWRFGVSALSVTLGVVAVICVALTVIDLRHRRLPNILTYPSYVIVAAGLTVHAAITSDWWLLGRGAVGMLALGGFYQVMRFASRGGMGRGDVVTAGFLGLLLGGVGWEALAVGSIGGPLIGGVAGIVAMIAARRARGVRIPYGPWLIGGAWIGLMVGDTISAWYLDVVTLSLS